MRKINLFFIVVTFYLKQLSTSIYKMDHFCILIQRYISNQQRTQQIKTQFSEAAIKFRRLQFDFFPSIHFSRL